MPMHPHLIINIEHIFCELETSFFQLLIICSQTKFECLASIDLQLIKYLFSDDLTLKFGWSGLNN